MTLKKIYKEQYGEVGWKKLSSRIKKLVQKIDSIPANRKPVSLKEIKQALK